MRLRWMIVHKIVLQTVLPILTRLPYRWSQRFLSAMGRLDLIVVPGQAQRYEAAVAGAARRLDCDWNVRTVSRALARQTYRWRVRDLLLDGRPDPWVLDRFQVSGREWLDQALGEGKGVILLANHFGSHVLMTHWMFRQAYPLRWFGERPRNVSEYLTRQFATDGALGQASLYVSRTAETAEAASAIYHAARILKGGLIVKVACDVRWRDAKAVPAAFLGGVASFSTNWVNLAAMTGAAVVPTFCRMGEDGTFALEFHEPWHIPPDARREGRAAEWVQRALAGLEREVRRHPDQSNDYFFWEPMTAPTVPPPKRLPSRASERAAAQR